MEGARWGMAEDGRRRQRTARNCGTRPPHEVPENRARIFCMGAQVRTDILPYISLIPVFRYFLRGTSIRPDILRNRKGLWWTAGDCMSDVP